MDAQRIPLKQPEQQELKHFFLSHLNRIYCAKSQLAEKLPQLGNSAHFLDLKQAITETTESVHLQIARMRLIYIELDSFYRPESCVGLVGMLDEAFQSIGPPFDSPASRDLSILFYMHNIESVEESSFKVLMLVADKLGKPGVRQMLLECYDEAKEDKILFKEITENYFQ